MARRKTRDFNQAGGNPRLKLPSEAPVPAAPDNDDRLTPRQAGFVREPNRVSDAESQRTVLMDAVLMGDAALAQRLVRSGADVNRTDRGGRSALHHAVEAGEFTLVAFLLAEGADPNLQTRLTQETPLHLALQDKDLFAAAEVLLAGGANVNIADKKGVLPLHLAVQRGDVAQSLRVVEDIIVASEDPNRCDSAGYNAMHYAARSGDAGAVEMLLFHRLDLFTASHEGVSVLHEAAAAPKPDAALLLLEHGGAELANAVDHEGRVPLHHAVVKGHADVVRALLDKGALTGFHDSKGKSPLHLAVDREDHSLMFMLAEHGADINAGTGADTPLMSAVRSGSMEKLRVLLDMGADPNQTNAEGLTALMVACDDDRADIAALLLEAGADPTLKTKEGRAALHYARNGIDAGLLQRMVHAGASLEDKDRVGRTALLSALYRREFSFALVLLDAGAKAKARDDAGIAALHLTVPHKRPDVIAKLLEKGADINVHEKQNGLTPLHYAAMTSQLNEVKRLLAHGADLRARDNHGRTALHSAVQGGILAEDVVRHLLDIGIDALTTDKQGATAYDLAHSRHLEGICNIFRRHFQKHRISYTPRNISPYFWGML